MKKDWAIWIAIGILIALSITSIIIAIHKPSGNSYPYVQTVQKDPAPVNYDKISSIVEQDITKLPTPQNGQNGANGSNGTNGQDATAAQIQAAVQAYLQANPPAAGPQGVAGVDGVQGQAGTDGQQIQLRLNSVSGNLEWRYSNQITWTTLVPACTFTGSCI